MARPRGAARGSASAILSMPVLAEKRTVTGTSCLKCNALLTLAASALGTNLPSRTTPLAWADRCVVCLPNAELSASTNVSGVVAIAGSFRVFIASSVGTIPQKRTFTTTLLAFGEAINDRLLHRPARDRRRGSFRRLPQADNAVYRKARWTLSHQSRHA